MNTAGPLRFEAVNYNGNGNGNGNIPTLILRANSWTKVSAYQIARLRGLGDEDHKVVCSSVKLSKFMLVNFIYTKTTIYMIF